MINANTANLVGLKDVVLVHGAFVDGSGWEGVHGLLTAKGYNVTVVQIQTATLGEDVTMTRRAVAAHSGPVVLVGHSYGGVVITEAGTDPKVQALVYIAAFAPDTGESVSKLIANPAPGAPVPPILPPQNGALFLDADLFAAAFAADVEPKKAAFMAASQLPWGVDALAGEISIPAWKDKPSWYLVAADDHMIPPPAQREMAGRAKAQISEVAGSHAVYVSKPEVVAAVIEAAAREAVARV